MNESIDKTCYIFAIGGTGARILTSLTHMLAAGSEYDRLKTWRFVPIIIDLDKNNGNLAACTQLMQKYKSIQEFIEPKEKQNYRFFRYPIETLKKVSGSEKLTDTYTFASNIKSDNNLGKLINYSTLGNTAATKGTRELIDLLYTKEDKEMQLDMGFKGKPHIGSVFFEQFSDVNDDSALSVFAEKFDASKDRIFIISSIFGGTGAAGFPWLVKFLRKANNSTNKLKGAKIGALSVQPYFSVSIDASSAIDSNSFHTKTKSALKYYSKNLKNHLNAIYYVGDSESPIELKNKEGGGGQKNPSSAIELIGATSILDFLNIKNEDIPNAEATDGLAINTKHYAYSIETPDTNKYTLSWKDLTKNDKLKNSQRRIFTPLLHFHIANIMVKNLLTQTQNIKWSNNTGLVSKNSVKSTLLKTVWNEGFFKGTFYEQRLKSYMIDFTEWLKELSGDEGANHFTYFPFEVNPNVGASPAFTGLINTIIKGIDLTDGNDVLLDEYQEGNTTTYVHGKNKVTYNELINYLNNRNVINGAKQISLSAKEKEKQQAQRLIYMTYNASLNLLKEQATENIKVNEFLA